MFAMTNQTGGRQAPDASGIALVSVTRRVVKIMPREKMG
jgi:hypothetical protein